MGSFLEAGREQNNTTVSVNTHSVGPSEQGGRWSDQSQHLRMHRPGLWGQGGASVRGYKERDGI